LDPRPLPGDTRHVTEQWLSRMATEGIDVAVGPPAVTMSPEEVSAARVQWARVFGGSNSLPVVIHPGSGGRRKCWPLDRFCELARRLGTAGRTVAFLLGPVEVERMDRADLDMLRRDYCCIEDEPLDRVAALLATAGGFIGNDSGVAHLAAAVGTATVAIFGPTDPQVWSPLGPCVRVVAPAPGDDWPAISPVLDATVDILGN